jgi:hypothetical protein
MTPETAQALAWAGLALVPLVGGVLAWGLLRPGRGGGLMRTPDRVLPFAVPAYVLAEGPARSSCARGTSSCISRRSKSMRC